MELRSLNQEALIVRRVDTDELLGSSPQEIIDDHRVVRMKGEIRRILAELEEELAEARDEATTFHDRDGYLAIGKVLIAGADRPVLGGHLTPVRSAPIETSRSPALIQFITQLDGGDWLKGETHGFGIHYHYHNWKGVRTDVILSWDTRWIAPDEKSKVQRPLFWEFHAERNAKGEARPRRWQPEKRLFVHAACKNDLKRWPISEFRCAGDDALPVWPADSILTSRPAAATPNRRRRR